MILSECFNQWFMRQVRDILCEIVRLSFRDAGNLRDARCDAFEDAQLAEHFERHLQLRDCLAAGEVRCNVSALSLLLELAHNTKSAFKF